MTKSKSHADRLVESAYALPIAERCADLVQWAQDIEAFKLRLKDDPIAEVEALQRVCVGLVEAAKVRRVPIAEPNWVSTTSDPIGAIRQAGGIAAVLAPALLARHKP